MIHRHPFRRLKDRTVPGILPPQSLLTWPFRLSFTHGKGAEASHGDYWPDQEGRIGSFIRAFEPGRSLVFLYLNHDNPVSADDGAFALVGCAPLVEIARTGAYDIPELAAMRRSPRMRNFSPENWALRVTHDLFGHGVALPYHRYLEHVAAHPGAEPLLDEIKVLVDEPSLVNRFKYVAEAMGDDHCLLLLYKLRRAFERVAAHGVVPAEDALERIDTLLGAVWQARGPWPGLAAVLGLLRDLGETGDVREEDDRRAALVIERLAEAVPDPQARCAALFELLRPGPLPEAFQPFARVIQPARIALRDDDSLEPALRVLAATTLSKRQLGRVIRPDPAWPRQPSLREIADNPYRLCEDPPPEEDRAGALNRLWRDDDPFDTFLVDLGLFPDPRHQPRALDLPDLSPIGPERLRAFAIEHLRARADRGDAFIGLDELHEHVSGHPLFHQEVLALRPEQLGSDRFRSHLGERMLYREGLHGEVVQLIEIRAAEEVVERVLAKLIDSPPLPADDSWVDPAIAAAVAALTPVIPDLDAELLTAERSRLLRGALHSRLFVATGRPGSGKTRGLQPLVRELRQDGQEVTVLAPTGKAALQATRAIEIEAQTIDRWLWQRGCGEAIEDPHQLAKPRLSYGQPPVENLIIDEVSMVGLLKLAAVCRALELQGLATVRRVILVGDEHQLAPIGCGRPLYDILDHLQHTPGLAERHTVRLLSNCRQETDPIILHAAGLFADDHRYHDELMARVKEGGTLGPGLNVMSWRTREELCDQLLTAIDQELPEDQPEDEAETETGRKPWWTAPERRFNRLFGLYPSGHVPGDRELWKFEKLQLLTPYRAGHAGTLGINARVREVYRGSTLPDRDWPTSVFGHADKVIRISNLYERRRDDNGRWQIMLRLSNGSIGFLNNKKDKEADEHYRLAYFPDAAGTIRWTSDADSEIDYEPAYAITVHKAQGSEFGQVLLVIPERRALLTRELVYTAMTRSRGRLTLFVQDTREEHPLAVARRRSALLARNSALLGTPAAGRRLLEPEPGVQVKSKVEYLIFATLARARDAGHLSFAYEQELVLPIDGKDVPVKADFTIEAGGRRFFWEHLGMLDTQLYAADWQRRRKGYAAAGLDDALVTTDDLGGLIQERIDEVIEALVGGKLAGEAGRFSSHHYRLY